MANNKEKRITLQLNAAQTYSGMNIVDCGFQSPDEGQVEGPINKTEYVLQYVVSGEGVYYIRGKSHAISAGDLFYLPKGELLSYRPNPQNPFCYWWLGFDGEFAKDLMKKIGLTAENPIMRLDNKRVLFLFQSIFSCIRKNNIVTIIRATSYAYELFSLLLSVREENNVKLRTNTPQYVKQALSYIAHHFAEPITIADLARNLGLNRMYFCTLFKKETGVSPYHYLATFRLEKARILLMNTDQSITDIAMQCGFNSINTFSDSFKASTGWSPLQFRKAKNLTIQENRKRLRSDSRHKE